MAIAVLVCAGDGLAAQRPDLALAASATPDPTSSAELTTFLLTVTNRGNLAATQVRLLNTLSSNASYFAVTVSQGTFTQTGNDLDCDVGTVNVGGSLTLRVVVTPQAVGGLTNSASLTLRETDANPADNSLVKTARVFSTTFLPAGNLNLARYQHTSTLLPNGKVLLTGGIVATGYTATVELYDPASNRFTWTASMDVPRHAHTATRLNNGTVLIVGTSSTSPRTTSSQLFDPVANTFTNTGNLIYPRNEHTATLLPNGKVLIAGGTRPADYHEWHAEVYDPATGGFTEIHRMQYPRGLGTAVGFTNGDVVVVGGFTAGALTEIFRYATSAFEPAGNALYNLWEGQGVRLPDGRALIVGGAADGTGMLAATQYYDSATGQFSAGPNLRYRRFRHSTTGFAPGKFLVAGGWEYPTLATAEIYDFATGGFTNTVSLRHAREWHAASALADGRVLVTGGHEGALYGTNILDSAELFDPAQIKLPPMVSIAAAALPEPDAGATNLTFALHLSAPMGLPVSVAWTAAPQWWNAPTATAEEDYAATNGVAIFAPGTTNQTLTVPVLGDRDFEGNEFFHVTLRGATNATLASTQAIATIVDNDSVPTVWVDPASVTEGNLRATNLVVPVRLSARSFQDIQVSFATSNGTAQAGSDYVATNGTLYFPAGATEQAFAVPVKGDVASEPSENFTVLLAGEVNATLGNNFTLLTILNDDGLPGGLDHFEITLPPAPRLAGTPLPLTIQARDAAGAPVTNFNRRVLLSVGTTEEAPRHFGFEEGGLGEWLPTNGGQQPGPYEFVDFDVSGGGERSLAFRTAAGIGADGLTRSVPLTGGRRYYVCGDFAQSNEGSSNNGGGTVAFLSLGFATLASAAFGGVNTGDVLRTNLNGSYDAPYTDHFNLGVTFQRNPWFQLYNIGAFADDLVASAAPITPRFTASFTNGVWSGTNAIGVPGANFVLRAEDVEGHLGDSLPFNVEQPANVALTASLTPAPPRVGSNLVLTLTATNLGPGPAPGVALTNVLPVGPAFVSATSSVGTCVASNGVVACDLGALAPGQAATVTLTLRPATFGPVTNSAALLPSAYDLVASNDTAVTAIAISPALISIVGSTVTERTGETTTATFTISVGEPHSDPITVDYATVDVTATNGVDYLAAAGQLVFPPGVNTQFVSVAVLDDALPEIAETFRLQLSNASNAALAGSGFGTGTILDNGDPLPEVTIDDVTLAEGDAGTNFAVFTVRLSRPAGFPVFLGYATANGTATSTTDYVATSGSLTFTAGQTNRAISVAVRGNTVNEPDEVFYVNVSTNRQNEVRVVLLDPQGVGTILNDDAVPGRLDHYDWAVSAPRVVGLPFAVTLTARDAFNNVATNSPTAAALSATALVAGKPTAIAIAPTNATPFVAGVWSGGITIGATRTNVILRADDGAEHIGLSGGFDVLPLIATALTLPGGASEGAGVLAGQGTLTVSLARGESTTFNLASSDATELTAPATVLLPANATNVAFNLTVMDDLLLDGTKLPSLSASAPGYLTTNAPFAVHDNEIAVLALAAPAATTESASLTGIVLLDAPAGDSVTVALTSSDPAQLQVPANVTIATGQRANTFAITPVNDLLLDGPQTILLTARVENWTNGVTAVTVLDDETNTVTINFAPPGATYYEGSGAGSNATLRLGGIVSTNVTVTLASSDATEASMPASVMIPAGTNSVLLPLTIPDDAEFDGTQSASLTPSAPGFVSLPVTVTVGDSELHHFDLGALPANFEAGTPVMFALVAKDINNATMTGFAEIVTLSATNANGGVPLSPASVTLTAGQWSGHLDFPNWEYAAVRLTVRSGGVAAQSPLFNVLPPTLRVVNAGGSELVFSPLNGRLYVNNPGGLLTPILAAQAQVEPWISIGAFGSVGPRMVAADDGQFLYLERSGGNVSRFNVAASTVDLTWNVGAPQIGDLAAVPGWPTAVALVRYDPYYSTPSRGTVVYNNGVALPNGAGGSAIDFDTFTRRLYCYDGETTAFTTGIFEVNASGLSGIRTVAMMSGFGVNFVCRGGLLFATSSQVFNPDRAIAIGANPGGMNLAGDMVEGRIYYWQNLGGGNSAIVAADLHTLVAIGSTTLPGVSSLAGSLIRWGTNGLAFRPNSSQVAIVRSAWVPTGPAADLVLTQTGASSPALVGGNYVCTFAVSNAGPGFATNVVLTATLPTTVASLTAASSIASNTVTYGGGVSCAVPALASGTSATVTLAFTPSKAGPFAFKVGVLSTAPDPNLANNRLALDAAALFITGYDSVIELALPANDLVYDSAHMRICASVPNANELLGNSIVTFDPRSAFYPGLIPTAVEPAKLAVADNGQYLYAGLNSEPGIQRVDLNARVADLKFPTGHGGVYDLEVMPGHAGVVAATVHTTVALYENGVKRPSVVGPTEYNFGYNLEFGANSNRLYASFPRGFRRIAVDPNGATLIEDVRNTLIASYDYDFDFNAGLCYTIDGRVFDPETKTLVNAVPYSGLVVADAATGRAYYLTRSGSVGTIHVLDMPSLTRIKTITVPGVGYSPASFIRWGADGLAFRTTAGQVFLIRDTSVNDHDWDGLEDAWETQYFGSINGVGGGAGEDPDGDRLTNFDEFRAGTNPRAAQSHLRIGGVQKIGGEHQVSFLTATGRRYRVERSLTLRPANWTTLADNLQGTGTTLEATGTATGNNAAFYRLVLLP